MSDDASLVEHALAHIEKYGSLTGFTGAAPALMCRYLRAHRLVSFADDGDLILTKRGRALIAPRVA